MRFRVHGDHCLLTDLGGRNGTFPVFTKVENDMLAAEGMLRNGDIDDAVELINTYSPRFVASIITSDPQRFERFYEGLRARGFFTHTERGQFRNSRVEVKSKFVVDLALDIATPWPEHAHTSSVATSGPAAMTRATAAT